MTYIASAAVLETAEFAWPDIGRSCAARDGHGMRNSSHRRVEVVLCLAGRGAGREQADLCRSGARRDAGHVQPARPMSQSAPDSRAGGHPHPKWLLPVRSRDNRQQHRSPRHGGVQGRHGGLANLCRHAVHPRLRRKQCRDVGTTGNGCQQSACHRRGADGLHCAGGDRRDQGSCTTHRPGRRTTEQGGSAAADPDRQQAGPRRYRCRTECCPGNLGYGHRRLAAPASAYRSERHSGRRRIARQDRNVPHHHVELRRHARSAGCGMDEDRHCHQQPTTRDACWPCGADRATQGGVRRAGQDLRRATHAAK